MKRIGKLRRRPILTASKDKTIKGLRIAVVGLVVIVMC